jgi:hypothetical protein
MTDPDIDIYPDAMSDPVITVGAVATLTYPQVDDKQKLDNLPKAKITLTYKIRANTLAQRALNSSSQD